MVTKPIFVVGCGRSGTTLLFDVLSQHPSLARTTGYPDGEDHEGWIRHGKCVMAGIGNVHHSQYGNGINGYEYCLHMTREDVTEDVVAGMHGHFRSLLGGDARKRVINKQPHLSNKLDYVLGIFPDARIVHIVRDCEPVVASWIAVMDAHPSLVVYWPEGEELPCFWLMPRPDDPVAIARLARHPRFFPGGGQELWIDYWCRTNVGIGTQMKGRESQLLAVRYEDLVASPERVLKRVTEFCEIDDFEFSVSQLRTDTARKHASRMTESLRDAIAVRARLVRESFGYEAAQGRDVAAGLFRP